MVSSGALLPSNAEALHEAKLLWFSADQRWEPTATKVLRTNEGRIRKLTFDEQQERFGCIRFGLLSSDPRLLPWSDACKVAKISRVERRALEVAGTKAGSHHSKWSATICVVSLNELRLEVWVGGWHPATSAAEMAAVWLDRS